jgi:hypothetical protein
VRTRIAEVLKGPRVIAVGGSTWSQGPSRYVRQFFELAGGQSLGGVSATAWVTAGGAHTGGEEVVSGILRSLMGDGRSDLHARVHRPGATPGERQSSIACYRRLMLSSEVLHLTLSAMDASSVKPRLCVRGCEK